MRKFFGSTGSVNRLTIDSQVLKNNSWVIRPCASSMCTFPLGMTDKDCPCSWIWSASRVAAYPIRIGSASARTCRNGSIG
jgi:hypothetical protein